jgi:hypothetical protein
MTVFNGVKVKAVAEAVVLVEIPHLDPVAAIRRIVSEVQVRQFALLSLATDGVTETVARYQHLMALSSSRNHQVNVVV